MRKLGLLLGGLLAVGTLAAMVRETAYIRYYGYRDNGSIEWVGTVGYETDGPGGTYGTVCLDLGDDLMCGDPCSSCHRLDPARAMKFQAHLTTYFPRAELRLAEGQQFKLGKAGYTVLQGGRLNFYTALGKRVAVAPSGSRLLKNSAGVVRLIYLNGQPTLLR
jgi:hypothetical protein